MMDDLVLECSRQQDDFIEVQDEEHGATSIRTFGGVDSAMIVLSREGSIALRDWLIEYLRSPDPIASQLQAAQSALTELMGLLPHLVRLADRVGVDISEQHYIDQAQTYIDIYEGRTNDLQT